MKTALAAVMALAMGLSACSDDVDEAERALVVDWLVEHDESPDEAECLADELSDYRIADFDALAAVSNDDDFDTEFKADVDAAVEACSAAS